MANIVEITFPESLMTVNYTAIQFPNEGDNSCKPIWPQCYTENSNVFNYEKYEEIIDTFPSKDDDFTLLFWVKFNEPPENEKGYFMYQGCFIRDDDWFNEGDDNPHEYGRCSILGNQTPNANVEDDEISFFKPFYYIKYERYTVTDTDDNDNISIFYRFIFNYLGEEVILEKIPPLTLLDENWHRIYVQHKLNAEDNSELTICFDESELSPCQYSINRIENKYPLIIGGGIINGGGTMRSAQCAISCVSIYKSLLDESLINSHYNDGSPMGFNLSMEKGLVPSDQTNSHHIIAFWELSEKPLEEDVPLIYRDSYSNENTPFFHLSKSVGSSLAFCKNGYYKRIIQKASIKNLESIEGPIPKPPEEMEFGDEVRGIKLLGNSPETTEDLRLVPENTEKLGTYDRYEKGISFNRVKSNATIVASLPSFDEINRISIPNFYYNTKYAGSIPKIVDLGISTQQVLIKYQAIIKETDSNIPFFSFGNDKITLRLRLPDTDYDQNTFQISVELEMNNTKISENLSLYKLPCDRIFTFKIQRDKIICKTYKSGVEISLPSDIDLINSLGLADHELVFGNHQVLKYFSIDSSNPISRTNI